MGVDGDNGPMNLGVAIVFVLILATLATALYFLLNGQKKSDGANRNMARALGLRVALSIALFACILLAWKLGYIHPTGVPIKTG